MEKKQDAGDSLCQETSWFDAEEEDEDEEEWKETGSAEYWIPLRLLLCL